MRLSSAIGRQEIIQHADADRIVVAMDLHTMNYIDRRDNPAQPQAASDHVFDMLPVLIPFSYRSAIEAVKPFPC